MTVKELFLSKVVRAEGCWLWKGSTSTKKGYGNFSAVPLGVKSTQAHRVSYQLFVGQIPDGYEIDHLCRNRACVNPEHLEAVTPRENQLRGFGFSGINARKTHCSKGHPFDDENTRERTTGGRECKECKREAFRDWYRRKRQGAVT